ncbi:unnamed protein product [Medioppia subpectinata]|uniref:Ketoreductase domain-containing protein n=1 Tax=Medioppia subpectinata TaxID=1979941 RepID=A0A7R9Q178_9ACAR|nr:unnamed protein product [Medioppia subpectinata]CAG2108261.1 unnamed protein product [Medioppia subpectinata]
MKILDYINTMTITEQFKALDYPNTIRHGVNCTVRTPRAFKLGLTKPGQYVNCNEITPIRYSLSNEYYCMTLFSRINGEPIDRYEIVNKPTKRKHGDYLVNLSNNTVILLPEPYRSACIDRLAGQSAADCIVQCLINTQVNRTGNYPYDYLTYDNTSGLRFRSYDGKRKSSHIIDKCYKICGGNQECYREYYQIVRENKYEDWTPGNATADNDEYANNYKNLSMDFRFMLPTLPALSYRMQPKFSFGEYLLFIGSIFSLWFGLSVLSVGGLVVSCAANAHKSRISHVFKVHAVRNVMKVEFLNDEVYEQVIKGKHHADSEAEDTMIANYLNNMTIQDQFNSLKYPNDILQGLNCTVRRPLAFKPGAEGSYERSYVNCADIAPVIYSLSDEYYCVTLFTRFNAEPDEGYEIANKPTKRRSRDYLVAVTNNTMGSDVTVHILANTDRLNKPEQERSNLLGAGYGKILIEYQLTKVELLPKPFQSACLERQHVLSQGDCVAACQIRGHITSSGVYPYRFLAYERNSTLRLADNRLPPQIRERCHEECGQRQDCYREYYQIVRQNNYDPVPLNTNGTQDPRPIDIWFVFPTLPVLFYKMQPKLYLEMSVKYDFTGKVVLITGSSSGIGAATAVQFAKAGAQVVVTGRRADKLAEVGKQCLKVSPKGIKALEVTADVTKREDMRRLVDQTIKHFGKLDILVNNAGASIVAKPDDKQYYEIFEKVMAINLNSVVYLTHICVEHLEKTKGNIVNISSVGSMRTVPGFSPYNVAKCALDMFTRCMAAELGPKRIRVNVINPGPIRTGFAEAMGLTKDVSDVIFNAYDKLVPIGRCGFGDDVADNVLYL